MLGYKKERKTVGGLGSAIGNTSSKSFFGKKKESAW